MQLYPGWSARDNYGYGSKKKKRKKERSPADLGGTAPKPLNDGAKPELNTFPSRNCANKDPFYSHVKPPCQNLLSFLWVFLYHPNTREMD